MWSLITIRQFFPPHSLFSPSTSNGETYLHPHTPRADHSDPREINYHFLPINLTPGSSRVTVGAAGPVDARCGKKRLYGCISVWLTLLWDARGGEDVPPDRLQKRVFSSLSGTVLGPGLSREAALVQDYRTVGWRRINKVRMTVSSSPPRPWRRLRGLSVVLPRDQAASDSGQNPFTQAAVIKIWNADVELGYFGLHCRGWLPLPGERGVWRRQSENKNQ